LDVEAFPVASTRRSSAFSWNVVPAEVIRHLLTGEYEGKNGDGQHDHDIAELRRLSDVGLAGHAAAVFSRPPKRAALLDHIEVLVEHWLPLADDAVLEGLVTIVKRGLAAAERNRTFRSRSGRIRFLQERNRTLNFKTNVAKEFLRAHRVERVVDVRPSARSDPALPIDLQGEGGAGPHPLYPHQSEAHTELDRLMRRTRANRRGIVVLPTGAGKTDTMVSWLLPRLGHDPRLRVLWIAHRQELLEQASARFAKWGPTLPPNERRRVRVVHSRAASPSVLAKTDVDIGLVTFASLANAWGRPQQNILKAFMGRPTIVVVDEAHHAGADSYRLPLEFAKERGAEAILGLTATPNPLGKQARRRVRELLGKPIIETPVDVLVASGVLACPVVHTIDTGEVMELARDEVQRSVDLDLPPTVLRRLAHRLRNDLIVETIAGGWPGWGKSLVFAATIEHAERLTDTLRQKLPGTEVAAVHSEMEDDRGDVLARFRESSDAGVLVSVGMLTEGIDLPDARTAFLARPTTSHILMRQMVGRVLRGPSSGGTTEGHVVYFRDEWTNFADILEPAEVLVDPVLQGPRRPGEPERRLPPVLADDQSEVAPDLVAAIERMYRGTVAARASGRSRYVDDDAPPPDVTLTTAHLAGFYRLPDRNVPVFDHQRDAYRELIDSAVAGTLQGRPPMSFFDDGMPPYPTTRSLRDLVEEVRVSHVAPDWVGLVALVGPGRAAERLLAKGALSETQRAQIVRDEYERTLARVAFATLERFEEAVERELRRRRQRTQGARPTGLEPEHDVAAGGTRSLRPYADRRLKPLLDGVHERASELLPPHVRIRLGDPPQVKWTRRVVSSTLAHWSIQLLGQRAGEQVIRVNLLLSATRDVVSDEMLEYLLWHELLHSLLPGQGHDAEFRELEARWPEAASLDAEFDTFHERWATDPIRYVGDR
jgi:superfamily II DNA or RNA helicase